MNMETNNNFDTTTEETQQTTKENKKSLFAELDKAKNEEASYVNKVDGFFSKFGKGFYKVRCVCCFTTLLITIGAVIMFLDINSYTCFMVGGYLAFFGYLSLLFTCPGRLIYIAIQCIKKGVKIGWSFWGIPTAVAGLLIGIFVGGGLAMWIPAVITIPYYFSDLKYDFPE